MALNKADIKEWTTDELIEKVQEEKVLLKKMEFNHTVATLDNPLLIRTKRRDIARLLTEIRKRELEAAQN